MTTPSSQFLPQLLLRLQTVLLLLGAASDRFVLAASAEQQSPITRPGCRDKCGNISIPFPFGIGPGCFRQGFEIFCNDSAPHPRAFLTDKRISQSVDRYDRSSLPLELVSISVVQSEARAYGMVSYDCASKRSNFTSVVLRLMKTSFAVSARRNVLTGVGWRVEQSLSVNRPSGTIMCRSFWRLSPDLESATNGSCTGKGCCEAMFPSKYSSIQYFRMKMRRHTDNTSWNASPCTYGMFVEKSWYNFSTLDLYGDMVLPNRYPRGVSYVLDFFIGNGSCPAEGQQPPSDYACVSHSSSCANATIGYGYVCKCWDNYDGNPYITNGCQDIDECKFPELYPCSSHGTEKRLAVMVCCCTARGRGCRIGGDVQAAGGTRRRPARGAAHH